MLVIRTANNFNIIRVEFIDKKLSISRAVLFQMRTQMIALLYY